MSDENQNTLAPALGPAVLRALGRGLRPTYADIIAEGVPEHFAPILRRMDEPTQHPGAAIKAANALIAWTGSEPPDHSPHQAPAGAVSVGPLMNDGDPGRQ
jgi:hypothetical protein